MSKFFKALEQAERDRALRGRAGAPPPPPAVPVARRVEPRARLAEEAGVGDGVEPHLVSLLTPAAFEAEQYRALRHAVESLQKARGVKIVAVSSPGVGDGKTTTAINLAGALAQGAEARVLLVDADLRRPSLDRFLALPGGAGLGLVGAILDPGRTLDQVTQPRPPFNLSVIPAGQAPPSPYEVLKSPRLGDLLDEARRRYDYVILDAPPLCPVQDCRVIARWVDGFLLVVTAHRTPRRLVEEALTVVERAKMLGVVFNGDDHPPAGYYGYAPGYYHPGEPPPDGRDGRGWRRAVRRVGAALHPGRGGRR